MAEKIKIALIQQHATKNNEDNLNRAVQAFKEAAQNGAQLIAFAELAFTYFYPQHIAKGDIMKLTETIPGPITDTFTELAKEYQIVTILNLFEKDGNKTYDSSPVIDATGSILGVTRMVHIIEAPCFHEQGYYTPGDKGAPVFATSVGKVGIAICYDRHYPEYMRALALHGAELVIIPQAGSVGEWPPGVYEAELQIASFQNGYFSALCNRVGQEDCIEFEGKSFVTAPDGRVVAQASPGIDEILYVDIDLDEVKNSNARNHFLIDRRPELYGDWLIR
jgi:N-carbamoylputrescine amidase